MKIIKIILFFFAITLSNVLFAATETFTIDPTHTYVQWRISHFDFSNQTGKWFANGTLTLDKDKPADSKVDVNIDMANIVTGLEELDKHLKQADFFDVAKYPTATFVSKKVTVTGKFTAKVTGDLTMHGVTKPVTLDVKINKIDKSPITKKLTVGFYATTKIKRSDFGITAYLPGLGDNVDITISGEAAQ